LTAALALNATANLLLKIGADRLGSRGAASLLASVLGNYHLSAVRLVALNVVSFGSSRG
jgi:hypothetical protein